MGKSEKVEITLSIKCPFCNSDFTYYVYPSKLSFDGRGYDIEDLDGYYEGDIGDHDFLIFGQCQDCNRTFKLGLLPERVEEYVHPDKKVQLFQDNRKLTKFDLSTRYAVVFNQLGYPVSLHVCGKTIPFKRVKYTQSYEPGSSNSSDLVYCRPPYGFYDIEVVDILHEVTECTKTSRPTTYVPNSVDNPRIVIEIRKGYLLNKHGISASPDKIDCRIKESDGFFRNMLTELEKSHKPNDVWLHDPTDEGFGNQTLPHEQILSSSYQLLYRIETLVRNKVWLVLRSKYSDSGGMWWKGVLKPDLQCQMKDRADRSGDKNFTKVSPQNYMTFGECIEIINEKWDKDFRDHFERKNQLIMRLKEVEGIRNDVMHFRVNDFEKFNELVTLGEKVLSQFK